MSNINLEAEEALAKFLSLHENHLYPNEERILREALEIVRNVK